MKKIAILGSTGSIGTQTLDVVRNNKDIEVLGLSCGKDITKLFYYRGSLKKAFASFLMPIAMKKHRRIEPSMLQDMKKGKPCEIDAINGVVCEWGRKTGIPTPVNDRIVEIVKKEQNGELPLSPDNLKLFNL